MNYDQFYLKYRKIARIYAYGVLKDWNIADDVSQDVLYKMYIMKNDLNFENEKMLELKKALLSIEEDRAAGKSGCTLDEFETYLNDVIES